MRTDLNEYQALIRGDELDELKKMQISLRKNDAEGIKALDGIQSDKQIVDSTLVSMGFNPKKQNSASQQKEVAAFRNAVDQEVINYQRQTGKKVNNLELQSIVDKLATRVITERGILWNNSKRLYQVQPGEGYELDIKEIPPTEIGKIQESLKRANIPVTDDRVIELYRRRIQGSRAGVR